MFMFLLVKGYLRVEAVKAAAIESSPSKINAHMVALCIVSVVSAEGATRMGSRILLSSCRVCPGPSPQASFSRSL
jgi:hypothetical protein